MKKNYLLTFTGGMAALSLFCACQDVRTSHRMVAVEINPNQADTGYVEFTPVSPRYPFPVYLVDPLGKPLFLANMGLKHGERYCFDLHGGPTGERLRVALPAGTHTFVIDNGPRVHVPVLAGKLTPVEVDYTLLDEAIHYQVYRADARPSAPGPFVAETEAAEK